MPWVRIDENAMGHPKIEALSDGAFRLWVRGLSYCQKFLTDGYICRAALKTMRGVSRGRVTELTTPAGKGMAPLWREQGDGFVVHDYLAWNESREHVIHARQHAKTRLDRFRQRVSNGVANGVVNGVSNANETLHTPPPPHHTTTQEDQNPLAVVTDDGFEAFWIAYPRKVAKSAAQRAWKRLKLKAGEQQAVHDRIQLQRNSEAWLKDGGQFIPYPATWLNQRRWEDELAPEVPAMSKQTRALMQASEEFLRGNHDTDAA